MDVTECRDRQIERPTRWLWGQTALPLEDEKAPTTRSVEIYVASHDPLLKRLVVVSTYHGHGNQLLCRPRSARPAHVTMLTPSTKPVNELLCKAASAVESHHIQLSASAYWSCVVGLARRTALQKRNTSRTQQNTTTHISSGATVAKTL